MQAGADAPWVPENSGERPAFLDTMQTQLHPPTRSVPPGANPAQDTQRHLTVPLQQLVAPAGKEATTTQGLSVTLDPSGKE